jgi:hypothetical protein
MKRWHQEISLITRQWKKHRQFHVDSNKTWTKEPGRDPDIADCPCDDQKGRFRKKDAYDCGRPGCKVCHSDKFPKRIKTEQEINSDLDFKEQITEFYEV